MKDPMSSVFKIGLALFVPRCIQREYTRRREQEKPLGEADSFQAGVSDREISERLNVVRQTISKRQLTTLKELREYLMEEEFEWPDK